MYTVHAYLMYNKWFIEFEDYLHYNIYVYIRIGNKYLIVSGKQLETRETLVKKCTFTDYCKL